MTTYNLASLLESTARQHPGRTAVVLGDHRTTYRQLDEAASQVASLLASRGIGPGDAVALMCPNLPQFTVIYNGILKAGAVVVPLNILLKSREVAYHLQDSGAKAFFAFEGTPELPTGTEAHAGFEAAPEAKHFFVVTADPAAPASFADAETLAEATYGQPTAFAAASTDEEDTAVVLYTSRTTGQPKGAELRHRNMRDNALAGFEVFRTRPDTPDTCLCALPLFHSFGQTVIQNLAIAAGGTIVMMPRFDARAALGLMARESVSLFAGVPTMYWALLRTLDGSTDVSLLARNLRVALAGGSALPVEIHREFERRFGVTILEGYGLSETSPVASFSRFGEPARPGSVGAPIPGVEMELLDPSSWNPVQWAPDAVGEIAIRGHNVFKGYLNRPDATREVLSPDGWFRTGDLARRDADGWYYIVGRAKELIIRGGFNVYPREIEEILLTHPAISLAAVIGVPHDSHGEEVKAFVVLTPGAPATPEEIIAWGRAQMASYKYPRLVEIVNALPMTATGKILKRELS